MTEVENQRLIANPLITAQRMPTGAVLMDTRSGECFELNRIGAEVWDTIIQEGGVGDLIAGLSRRYGADAEQVRADVRRLLETMIRHGIVTARAE